MQEAIGEQLNKWFHLSDESLGQIKSFISRELELGLRDEDAATIKMLITYVRELSRGDEIGSYLALDLGGTHFRVLLVQLNGDGNEPKVTSVTHDIPHALLVTQNGQELFDYIAIKLLEFVQHYKLKRRRISLGFTFSFPCKQYGLTQSYLVKWCKGFNVGGVINTDVVKQLKDALKRQLAGRVQAYIDVVAVLNDTTGTLVACANKQRDCRIGLIVGTGYNACYMERLDRCEKWPANYTSPKQVIINCEWGAMGDSKKRRELDQFRNELDQEVDSKSVNPLNQTYEKMVSGMYVGELLRLALLQLYNKRMLFHNCESNSSSTKSQRPTTTSTTTATSTRTNITASSTCTVTKGNTTGVDVAERLAGVAGKGVYSSSSSSSSSPSLSSSSSKRRKLNSSQSSKSKPNADPARGRAPSPAGSRSNSPSTQSLSCTASRQRCRRRHKRPDACDQTRDADANALHKLHVKDILDGRHLSLLAQDELAGTHNETSKLLKELNIYSFTELDMETVVSVAGAIMRRAAHLVASGISALLDRLQRPFTVIGYDGSLVKYHPYFLKLLVEKTATLTSSEFKFQFVQSSDGSGIGAAVVAAALHKERRPLYIVKPGKLYEMHFLRTQLMQSQLSFEGSLAQGQAAQSGQLLVPGLERVGSASSRTSNASSAVSSPSATVNTSKSI